MEEKNELKFECVHNQSEGTMTCSWLNGRVKLIENFEYGVTNVVVDGETINTYKDISIQEFMKVQEECQQMAENLI